MITLKSGLVVSTGLLMPATRPRTFAAYADRAPMLSREQIENVVFDADRMPARRRFGADWIGNQGNRNSCNGYAGAKSLQRARVRRGLPRVNLSGEGLYAQINGGRDDGSMLDDGMQALMNRGVPPEALVPRGVYRWNQISNEAKQACERFKGFECYQVDSEMELASALALGFDCVVAVEASDRFDVDREGMVHRSVGPGNHAVVLDDVLILNQVLTFDMPNSWGPQWGVDGRGYITWQDHLRGSVRNHAFYAIRSTSDDLLADDHPPRPIA